MAQIWKVRLPDGRTLTPGDWTSAEPLYSAIEVNEGAFNVLSAFSYGKNGEVPGSIGPRKATLADTNLEGEGGRLPENEELVIYNLAIEAFQITQPADLDDIAPPDAPLISLQNMLRLQRDLITQMWIAGVKEYTHHPIGYFPGSTGIHGITMGGRSEVGAASYMSAFNGGQNVYDIKAFASPLYVAGGETFRVDITPGPGSVVGLLVAGVQAAAGRIRFRIFLDGYRRRPVA
jgi:hypothetical protein